MSPEKEGKHSVLSTAEFSIDSFHFINGYPSDIIMNQTIQVKVLGIVESVQNIGNSRKGEPETGTDFFSSAERAGKETLALMRIKLLRLAVTSLAEKYVTLHQNRPTCQEILST